MKIFLLELNEFNKDKLAQAAQMFDLKNIKKVLSWTSYETFTADTYESHFLEPWVQWVSVHTGRPSSEHQVKHLGDSPPSEFSQIWQKLSDAGFTSGIFGAMNARRGQAPLNQFFLPDPWTASEKAFPDELNLLLTPIRNISKHYVNPSKKEIFKALEGAIRLFYKQGVLVKLIAELPRLIKQIVEHKARAFVFIAFLEYALTLLFLSYKKKYRPDFTLLFINTLAHLQHHHWHEGPLKKKDPLTFGYRCIDKILGLLLANQSQDEVFFIANALSQTSTEMEAPWILYRPKSHEKFLKAIGVYPLKIQEHMTHDAHLVFQTKEQAKEAAFRLKSVTVNGLPLFVVESYDDQPRLFYRLEFTDPLDPSALLTTPDKTLPFFDYYKKIVQRTGKHIPKGDLISSIPLNFSQIPNHMLCQVILDCMPRNTSQNQGVKSSV